MKLRGLVGSLALVAALPIFGAILSESVPLEGAYAGHLQDVWYAGGESIWWAHTRQILRTDLNGRILAKADVKGHNAGCEVRGGRLYVAVCGLQKKQQVVSESTDRVQVNVYDAETLAPLEEHVLNELPDRAGSLAMLPDGSFVVGCLRPKDIAASQVRFHHISADFKPIRSVVLDDVCVRLGIETIKYWKGELYLCMYAPGGLTIVLDATTFAEKRRYRGFNGTTGLAFVGDRVWVGQTKRDRESATYTSSLVAATLPRPMRGFRPTGTPFVQAHRGGRYEYDDNAVGGFVQSLARGIRGFETDVRFSKDHRLVIHHDARVDAKTDGTGTVEELSLADLKKCRLRACSEPIATPAEIFAALGRRPDIFIEIEMKAKQAGAGSFYTDAVLEDYCRQLNAAARKALLPGTYAFTSFYTNTLAMMRRIDPTAPLGFITDAMTDDKFAQVKALGCVSIAPTLAKTNAKTVTLAHAEGIAVCLWMVQNAEDYAKAARLGVDRVTSDYPVLLSRAIAGRPKKVVALDLDATLCQHRSPLPPENRAALKALEATYKCVMMGAGNAPRIYAQMEKYPIDIVGNYGMQIAEAADGNFRIVKAVTNTVDRNFFRRETDRLRAKYGYTDYAGDSLEFHASGMVTFGLLGTSPAAEHKVAFDPDRKKRRAMYPEICRIFKDFSVYIGGSTSFDFAGPRYNKYDATIAWAKDHGYSPEDVVFVGDDFADGGGDSHVRIKGLDHIVIDDYRKFPDRVSVLLK